MGVTSRKRYDVATEGSNGDVKQQNNTRSTNVTTLFRVQKIIGRLSIAMGVLSGIILCLMLIIIWVDVTGRYCLDKPLVGAMELSVGALVFIAALSLVYTQNQRGHLVVTILTEHVSQRWQILLDFIGLVLGLGIVSFLAWQNLLFAVKSYAIYETSWTTLPLPLFPMKFALFVGYVLLCIHYILDLFTIIKMPGERIGIKSEEVF
jgi:TRAP-type C4-dicarboxylate transport system permease small subunit